MPQKKKSKNNPTNNYICHTRLKNKNYVPIRRYIISGGAYKNSRIAFIQEVLNDYRIAFESREASLLGRREVLAGKAKFGIFGDGKEVAQVAMAKYFKEGDFRIGLLQRPNFYVCYW